MKPLTQITIACFLLSSCANIVMPTGGEKDIIPPKLLKTFPKNNTTNFNDKSILFEFDENIAVNKWIDHFSISPLTEKATNFKFKNKTLLIELENQLKENTTYSINLNKCVKDINEGNVLDDLNFSFSTGNFLDSLFISGKVLDALTLKPKSNVKVFLHESNVHDSLSYETRPKYVTKTNENGSFILSNLNNKNYNLYCITGVDYKYHDQDLIGFYSSLVTANDTGEYILYLYDPLYSKPEKNDSIESKNIKRKTEIIVNCALEKSIIFEIYREKKLIKDTIFESGPYIIENIEPGTYELKIIIDDNKNNTWDPGNHITKKLPEKVYIYNDLINLRENWSFELDCFIN